jgi:hypothetical protein
MDLLRDYGKILWTYFDRWRKFMFLSRPVMKAGTREGGFQLLVYSTSTTKQTVSTKRINEEDMSSLT